MALMRANSLRWTRTPDLAGRSGLRMGDDYPSNGDKESATKKIGGWSAATCKADLQKPRYLPGWSTGVGPPIGGGSIQPTSHNPDRAVAISGRLISIDERASP